MAHKAMIEKRKKEPKYKTRAYTRYRLCGKPHSVLKKFEVYHIYFGESAYEGEISGYRKVSW